MSTVKDELRRLFPDGTLSDREEGDPPDWALVPPYPADLFAAAAHLLEASGAYQYIVAPYSSSSPDGIRYGYDGPTFAPDRSAILSWTDIGHRWASNSQLRSEVQPYWEALIACETDRLVVNPSLGEPLPEWWAPCHAMLVIADEASGDFGYDYRSAMAPSASSGRWANAVAVVALERYTERRAIPSSDHPGDDDHLSRHVALDSLGSDIDRHVARVFPKGRTTETGCTLKLSRTTSLCCHPMGVPMPIGISREASRASWTTMS